jgi:hypothetical protein
MCTVANLSASRRGNSTLPLSPLALRHLGRLTNGPAEPPKAALPINDGAPEAPALRGAAAPTADPGLDSRRRTRYRKRRRELNIAAAA